MVELEEQRERSGKKEVFFKVSAMPEEHFKRFKELSEKEFGGSYWHTIKYLVEWYDLTRGVKDEHKRTGK